MEITILEEEIDQLKDQLNRFEWTTEESQETEAIRKNFLSTYNQQKITNLTENDYFSGDGRREGCMAYDWEWGTKRLGSIQGGSKYKFGYETDFPKIKSLIQKVTSLSLDSQNSYQAEGMFLKDLEEIIKLSKEIKGFKTGRKNKQNFQKF